jgi:hypothetical protein
MRASQVSAPIRDLSVGGNNVEESDATMKKTKRGSKEGTGGDSPSQQIDARTPTNEHWPRRRQ